MAQLIVNLNKLKYNLRFLNSFCKSKNIELVGVVKGCYAFHPIINCFYIEGVTTLGLSQISVAHQIAPFMQSKPFLIALPSQSQAEEVTRLFKTSTNSEISTIRSLADAANHNKEKHEIILMVDNGDLREGIMPDNVLATVQEILQIKSDYLVFAGLGTNLACCNGTLPNQENLALLPYLAERIEDKFKIEVRTISVGGSVMLDWMQTYDLPSRINQIRLGEAIFLGNIPGINRSHPALYTDVLTLRGEVLEIKEKPSIPSCQTGRDFLGNRPVLKDKGHRKRAIINFGIVDTEPSGLTPRLDRIERISSSSNYTIYDVTDCKEGIRTGDALEFDMNYHAMIQSFLTPYMDIKVIDA